MNKTNTPQKTAPHICNARICSLCSLCSRSLPPSVHPLGLWAGLVPRIVMIGTLTAAQWFIYDAVKVTLRMPRPPPAEMPDSLKKKLGLA